MPLSTVVNGRCQGNFKLLTDNIRTAFTTWSQGTSNQLSGPTGRHSEPSLNRSLRDLLSRRLSQSTILAENTQVIRGHPSLKPDVLITSAGRSPVAIEAEYGPAASVEDEARRRLGLVSAEVVRPIESAIAVSYPAELSTAPELDRALEGSLLRYCVLAQVHDRVERFPQKGWIGGSVTDLADMVRLVSAPRQAVLAATDRLQDGIDAGSAILSEMRVLRPAVSPALARTLGMRDVEQTDRMACAILANALVFHERLAGSRPEIESLNRLCDPAALDPASAILDSWDRILEINYWPIFAIARDLLAHFPARFAAPLLRELAETARSVEASGAPNAHDLTGRIFQRLIADRKYLATYYTAPASAALLARLGVGMLQGVDYSDERSIRRLRIGDFACGTGALLAAAYEQVAARHERAGSDPTRIHATMLEDVLYGCDVMPSAVHITGSVLSGISSMQAFGRSRLYALAYGRQRDGAVRIGSLELLKSSSELTLFNTSDPGLRTSGIGEETAAQLIAEIPDEGFDLVLMNPPFTRNVTREGAFAQAVAAAFAAFDTDAPDQLRMADRLRELSNGTCYHGNAGLATAFAALADQKLRPGGVMGLILPLSAASGKAWTSFRRLLAANYESVSVVSISAAGGEDMAFSADTGMADLMVLARKSDTEPQNPGPVRFVSLRSRPADFVDASAAAHAIRSMPGVRSIDDGPFGGSPLEIGDDLIGSVLDAKPASPNFEWGGVRTLDFSLAQTAAGLARSQLWLPGTPEPVALVTTHLENIASLGPYHLDINGPPPRGPFSKSSPSPTATYPALWNHSASQETRLICRPDSQLLVRPGLESKAARLWAMAGRAHLNLDFQFNSQPLQVAITRERTLGGTAWPNVNFGDPRLDLAFSLWANSTLGLLSFWWHSSRQQSGRGRITLTTAKTLPVADLSQLSERQLEAAKSAFEALAGSELMPAHLAVVDPVRARIDRRLLIDVLGLPEESYRALRLACAKWCAEPSVAGTKPPADAEPVI